MFRVAGTQLSLGVSAVVDCPFSRAELYHRARRLASEVRGGPPSPAQGQERVREREGERELGASLGQRRPTAPLPPPHTPQHGARVALIDCLPSDEAAWRERLEGRGAADADTDRAHKPRSWADLQALLRRWGAAARPGGRHRHWGGRLNQPGVCRGRGRHGRRLAWSPLSPQPAALRPPTASPSAAPALTPSGRARLAPRLLLPPATAAVGVGALKAMQRPRLTTVLRPTRPPAPPQSLRQPPSIGCRQRGCCRRAAATAAAAQRETEGQRADTSPSSPAHRLRCRGRSRAAPRRMPAARRAGGARHQTRRRLRRGRRQGSLRGVACGAETSAGGRLASLGQGASVWGHRRCDAHCRPPIIVCN
jgi:hypothetical protein